MKCSDSVTTQPLNMEVCPALDPIKTKKSAIPKTIAQWMVSGRSGGNGKNVNLIEEKFVVEKLVDSKDGKDGVNMQVLMGRRVKERLQTTGPAMTLSFVTLMVSGVNGVSGVSVSPPVEKEPKGPENEHAYLICPNMVRQ